MADKERKLDPNHLGSFDDFARREKRREEADPHRLKGGAQFDALLKNRKDQLADPRGSALLTVPEADARRRDLEDAIDRGRAGPNGEEGEVLARAYMGARIDQLRRVSVNTFDDDLIRRNTRTIGELNGALKDGSKLSAYLHGHADDVMAEALQFGKKDSDIDRAKAKEYRVIAGRWRDLAGTIEQPPVSEGVPDGAPAGAPEGL